MSVQRTSKPPDYALMVVVALLLAIGLVMVYSASMVEAQAKYQNSFHYLQRQALWVALGVTVMLVVMRLDYAVYQRIARPMLIGSVVLLAIVLVPGVGVDANGARRWIGFGSLSFQPSELAKLAFVIFMADFYTRNHHKMGRFLKSVAPVFAVLGIAFALVMAEPDMGTGLTIAGTGFLVTVTAGANLGHMSSMALMTLPALWGLARFSPYRYRRLTTFLDPFHDPQGAGYQIIQGLYALGSGGLLGVGLGRSRQKFFYLPERHTDMIFAILGEELGFVGALVVLLLFLIFAWRGYRIAIMAPDRFSSLLAVGITTWIILQACMNIAVVTSTIPMTGIPLPFISYGGSSLLFILAGVGILLGISRYSTKA